MELVGAPETCAQAADILREVGMFPLILRKEIDAHIADRLLEAVWRESLWLVKDGIATTEEIDEAIRMGFDIRWAQMGLFETYRIAGGEAGMKHFMAQFGPALSWPWTKLMDVPEFTEDLVDLIAGQSDAQSGHRTIRELERLRDDNIVGMVRALRRSGSGAGGVIRTHEETLKTGGDYRGLPVTSARQVPASWTDYNGHMNETRYLEAASQATDRFMEIIGADAAYVASGFSYFTVETHLRFLDEVQAHDRLTVTTQVLSGSGQKDAAVPPALARRRHTGRNRGNAAAAHGSHRPQGMPSEPGGRGCAGEVCEGPRRARGRRKRSRRRRAACRTLDRCPFSAH